MRIMPLEPTDVVGGIDTHQDLHTAAVLDPTGQLLGSRTFPTTAAGYRALLAWFRSKGPVIRVGIESTGTYGAGIARHLDAAGMAVLEVTGPDPSQRRRQGKDDRLDAIAAAQAALWGQRVQVAKQRSGAVEALRALRTTRRSAVKGRRVSLQVLHATLVAAPEEIRDRVRDLPRMQRLRLCAAWRPDRTQCHLPATATKISLKTLARRILALNREIADLNRLIEPLVAELAPGLLALSCVGPECAGEFLVTAGENPQRLRSEASFAMLCGASPIPASSGKTTRHRLNRGGNRQANSALHIVVVSRMRCDQRTKTYVARRLGEGKSKKEVIRCLKRYVAREVYKTLLNKAA